VPTKILHTGHTQCWSGSARMTVTASCAVSNLMGQSDGQETCVCPVNSRATRSVTFGSPLQRRTRKDNSTSAQWRLNATSDVFRGRVENCEDRRCRDCDGGNVSHSGYEYQSCFYPRSRSCSHSCCRFRFRPCYRCRSRYQVSSATKYPPIISNTLFLREEVRVG
jgi:hypothetical protein